MENIVYRLSDDKWKSLMVSSGFVHVSSKRHDTPLSFHGSIEKKGMLESLKSIPVSAITQLSLVPAEDELRISWLGDGGKEQHFTADFDQESDARKVAELLAGMRNLGMHERAVGKWRAIKTPGIAFLVVLAVTVICHAIAVDLEAGQSVEPTGRRAWVKLLLIGIAEALGAMGTLIVGGAVSLLLGYWLFKRMQSPPLELVWR